MIDNTISEERMKEAILDQTLHRPYFSSLGLPDTKNDFAEIVCDNVAYRFGVAPDFIEKQFHTCWRELFGSEDVPQKLTSEIRIVPVGMKYIGLSDPEEDCPLEYRDEYRMDQNIDGDKVARITVYDVKIVPLKMEWSLILRHRVQYALGKVAKQHHDFEPPDDTMFSLGDIYWYPTYDRTAKKLYEPNVVVDETDGSIVLKDRLHENSPLDFDDLCGLYNALKQWVEPSRQIAEALDMAGHMEERSPPMERDVFGDGQYKTQAVINPEEQLGNIYAIPREKALQTVLVHMTALYVREITDEKMLAEHARFVAFLTLAGYIPDNAGILPAIKPEDITASNENMGPMIEKRSRDILLFIAGADAADQDADISSKLRVIRRTKNEAVQQVLQGIQRNYLNAVGDYLNRWWVHHTEGMSANKPSFDASMSGEGHGENLSDLMLWTGIEPEAATISFYLPRIYGEKKYRSKPFGTSPRHEMPKELQPFLPADSMAWLYSAMSRAHSQKRPAP